MLVGITLFLTACQKEQTEFRSDPQINQQFDEVDNKIGEYLDALDNPNTSKEQSMEIICEDFPKTYKTVYMPALLKISSTYTKQGLLNDLDVVLNVYKNKLNIKCID